MLEYAPLTQPPPPLPKCTDDFTEAAKAAALAAAETAEPPPDPAAEDDEPYSSSRPPEQPLLRTHPDKAAPRSAELSASFASKLSFSFLSPLLALGRRRASRGRDGDACAECSPAARQPRALAQGVGGDAAWPWVDFW